MGRRQRLPPPFACPIPTPPTRNAQQRYILPNQQPEAQKSTTNRSAHVLHVTFTYMPCVVQMFLYRLTMVDNGRCAAALGCVQFFMRDHTRSRQQMPAAARAAARRFCARAAGDQHAHPPRRATNQPIIQQRQPSSVTTGRWSTGA